MPERVDQPDTRPYPVDWEAVAELRVFRTTAQKWGSLISWRREMRRKGWRLLKVTTERSEIVAVFGRTRAELKARSAEARP